MPTNHAPGRILLAIIAVITLGISFGATALAYDDWDIQSFDDSINLQTDGGLTVTETLVIDYSRESHRGPIRSIPIRYKDQYSQNFNLRFNLVSVTDENGKPYKYEVSNDGEYVKIKIGSADTYINSVVTYKITYNVKRAIIAHENKDELYWNVNGTESLVPHKNVSATVTLPSAIQPNQIETICFTGQFGATGKDCTTQVTGNTVTIKATRELAAFEGLTFGIQFPSGIINRPSFFEEATWFLTDNWGYLIPLIAFAYLFYVWYTRGRDPHTGRETIMPLYTPPDKLTPSEVGTIIDESVDMRDITATIVDMAVRGYLKITEKKEKVLFFNNVDYEFEKLKDFENDATLKQHESQLLKGIFGTASTKKLSSLKNEFYKALPGIKSNIYQELVKEGYFPSDPEAVRNVYYGIGGFTIFALFFFGGVLADINLSILAGIAMAAILFLIFAKHMPAKTKKGAEAKWQILGLEEFIKTAETDRLKFQEKENIFEKLLPYAMTLGIAEKWTNAFKDIVKTPPNWYQSSDPGFNSAFNTMYLLHGLNSMSTTAASTFTSSPRSSSSGGWSGGSSFGGGGFSGGGFGGGGTSSW
ncbi:MAG TPA: DUF2207 domain-containing protein [Candidatus Gracilibacteria bacterium]|nr:DUF2207 domain-containing protein [Candidatus Gracilibacteria bacterium]